MVVYVLKKKQVLYSYMPTIKHPESRFVFDEAAKNAI